MKRALVLSKTTFKLKIKTATYSNSHDNADDLDNSNEYTPTPKRRR
ncbi:hypothetical protein [Helicobacter pylori]|nr:hypothetical protein [Helicobacter pylori]